MRALLAASFLAAVASASFAEEADVAPSAYLFRRDRPADANPPESWIGLIQYAGLPYDRPVDPGAPELRKVICALLWEEVRPVRRVILSWPDSSRPAARPSPEGLAVTFLDGTDDSAHTWWNPRTVRDAGKPAVSPDGSAWTYSVPADTWCVVVEARGDGDASSVPVPEVRAFVPDPWKTMEVEIEAPPGDVRLEAYDGRVERVRRDGDRVRADLRYIGSSRWRRVWPYHAPADEVARTIVTVRAGARGFSFRASDLELGPILAPEQGFFVRAVRTDAPEAPGVEPGLAPLSPTLLPDRVSELPGVPKVRGWARSGMPWFGVNPDASGGTSGTLTVPPRCAAMHPAPDADVAAGWRSPIAGRVGVRGKVAMGDSAGGNGVEWSLVLETPSGPRALASGAVPTGGAAAFPEGRAPESLAAVPVEAGDVLWLVLGARDGQHACDTTIVDLFVQEVGGAGRAWDLVRDVADRVHEGNPHADSLGNPDVWRFCSLPAAPPPPAPSEPPFPMASTATSAREFRGELRARGLETIRRRTRTRPDQTWDGAVRAMRPGEALPPHPAPPFEPPMRVEVPCERLTAQWKLGAWHILRRSLRTEGGTWRFNDYPFGILASETYMLLRALDLQGVHQEAADGLDQWLGLPMEPKVVPGRGGHHPWALPDRPLGHFSDGRGCLTHAEGIEGAGGHMDGVHCMGPGAILYVLTEHFLLTGDEGWLRNHAPRMQANAEWILRQRKLLARNLPGGDRLWSKGLQPAHVVTPDSLRMHMQFYESEAYYWLGVRRMAELLARIDPAEGAAMAAEAEAYRKDLLAAVDRSILLTPVVAVRDGTYRSFIPFAPYVRGFATGAWGWRRCQGHVGAIYWDTVQSADPLVSPAGLLSPLDPRVQGHLDVLEDRLLLENTKIRERTPDFDAERDWFSRASWQYQCGLERHANIHLDADDAPSFVRSMLNQYAVDIVPGEYTFREHTANGPPDKIYEESCFLERFRGMLVHEAGGELWLARATPRAWLEPGKRISVRDAPSHLGPVSYEIVADAAGGRIAATVAMPPRPGIVVLRLRHPTAAPMRSVTVDGRPWSDLDREAEAIRLGGLSGTVRVEASY